MNSVDNAYVKMVRCAKSKGGHNSITFKLRVAGMDDAAI